MFVIKYVLPTFYSNLTMQQKCVNSNNGKYFINDNVKYIFAFERKVLLILNNILIGSYVVLHDITFFVSRKFSYAYFINCVNFVESNNYNSQLIKLLLYFL